MGRLLLLIGILLVGACARGPGIVRYGPLTTLGGYKETEIEPGVWLVFARSNDKKGDHDAWSMAEYRASELLKAQGFTYIQILRRNAHWELSEDLGGGRREMLSDEFEVTVRGAHDNKPPTDCRPPSVNSCFTVNIDLWMKGLKRHINFPKGGSD